jgi:hypothetical protein
MMCEVSAGILQEAVVNIGFVCQLRAVYEEHSMWDVKIRRSRLRYFIALQ